MLYLSGTFAHIFFLEEEHLTHDRSHRRAQYIFYGTCPKFQPTGPPTKTNQRGKKCKEHASMHTRVQDPWSPFLIEWGHYPKCARKLLYFYLLFGESKLKWWGLCLSLLSFKEHHEKQNPKIFHREYLHHTITFIIILPSKRLHLRRHWSRLWNRQSPLSSTRLPRSKKNYRRRPSLRTSPSTYLQ